MTPQRELYDLRSKYRGIVYDLVESEKIEKLFDELAPERIKIRKRIDELEAMVPKGCVAIKDASERAQEVFGYLIKGVDCAGPWVVVLDNAKLNRFYFKKLSGSSWNGIGMPVFNTPVLHWVVDGAKLDIKKTLDRGIVIGKTPFFAYYQKGNRLVPRQLEKIQSWVNGHSENLAFSA